MFFQWDYLVYESYRKEYNKVLEDLLEENCSIDRFCDALVKAGKQTLAEDKVPE